MNQPMNEQQPYQIDRELSFLWATACENAGVDVKIIT
jgi:hypothetical protein